MNPSWAWNSVENPFIVAEPTLRRLPEGNLRHGHGSWPDVVRDSLDAYGPASSSDATLIPDSRIACSIESIRMWTADATFEKARAMLVFPVPASPSSTISMLRRV
jgi:hypothetical protein